MTTPPVLDLSPATMDALGRMLKAAEVSTLTVGCAFTSWMQWLHDASGLAPSTISNASIYVNDWIGTGELATIRVSDIDQKHINQWVNQPFRKSKAVTRRIMLWAVSQFLNYCSANGWIRGNPAKLVRVRYDLLTHRQKETVKRIPFTEAEVDQILAATAPGGIYEHRFWHIATTIGRWTGLRLIDIATLEWASLAKPGCMVVWTAKRDRRVELPLEPDALADAIGMIDILDERYCFPEHAKIATDVGSRATLPYEFGEILRKLGIKRKSFHCLRYTFIQDMQEQGIPIEHIAVSAGHSSTATTKGYMKQ